MEEFFKIYSMAFVHKLFPLFCKEEASQSGVLSKFFTFLLWK